MSLDLNSPLGDLLNQTDIMSVLFDPATTRAKKQLKYNTLMRGLNILSYSTLGGLDTCERLFAIKKLELAAMQGRPDPFQQETNMDFSFGRMIETGVQAGLFGKSKEEVFWDMFLSWNLPLFMEHPKKYDKTFVDAVIAIDKFYYIRDHLFRNKGWEIAFFNGKPAIELSFIVDLGNGYYYVGHVDVVLYNEMEQRYRVLEIKSTAMAYLHEAMYANSDQATGYSIVVDSIATDQEQTNTFEVFYLSYSSKAGQFTPFEFTKSRSQRAGWINTLLLDVQRINIYKQTGHWPKRGSSCFNYYRPCKYFGICDLEFSSFNSSGEFEIISKEEIDTFEFDFRFHLEDIIKTQEALI